MFSLIPTSPRLSFLLLIKGIRGPTHSCQDGPSLLRSFLWLCLLCLLINNTLICLLCLLSTIHSFVCYVCCQQYTHLFVMFVVNNTLICFMFVDVCCQQYTHLFVMFVVNNTLICLLCLLSTIHSFVCYAFLFMLVMLITP